MGTERVNQLLRHVQRFIERTIDANGQALIEPDLTLEGSSTSLLEQFSAHDILALYADHGTHEQLHSVFKTDLELARLPSGKIDTNYLSCKLDAPTLNTLRLMSKRALLGPDAPARHPTKRRQIKTVKQELIARAGRLKQTGRRSILGLGANDRAAKAFARVGGG